MAGLDLMSAEGFARGADTGRLVDGGDIGNSRLVRAVALPVEHQDAADWKA